MASRVTAHHAMVASTLHLLETTLPSLVAGMAEVDESAPIPPALMEEGFEPEAHPPQIMGAVATRARLLLNRLTVPVAALQPAVHALLEVSQGWGVCDLLITGCTCPQHLILLHKSWCTPSTHILTPPYFGTCLLGCEISSSPCTCPW